MSNLKGQGIGIDTTTLSYLFTMLLHHTAISIHFVYVSIIVYILVYRDLSSQFAGLDNGKLVSFPQEGIKAPIPANFPTLTYLC